MPLAKCEMGSRCQSKSKQEVTTTSSTRVISNMKATVNDLEGLQFDLDGNDFKFGFGELQAVSHR